MDSDDEREITAEEESGMPYCNAPLAKATISEADQRCYQVPSIPYLRLDECRIAGAQGDKELRGMLRFGRFFDTVVGFYEVTAEIRAGGSLT